MGKNLADMATRVSTLRYAADPGQQWSRFVMPSLSLNIESIRYDTTAQQIHLTLSPLPGSEAFAQWLNLFCHQYGLHLVELAQGADRAQAYFRFQQQDFLLNLEWLCDAAWIENISASEDTLSALAVKLQAPLSGQ